MTFTVRPMGGRARLSPWGAKQQHARTGQREPVASQIGYQADAVGVVGENPSSGIEAQHVGCPRLFRAVGRDRREAIGLFLQGDRDIDAQYSLSVEIAQRGDQGAGSDLALLVAERDAKLFGEQAMDERGAAVPDWRADDEAAPRGGAGR